MNFFCTNNNNYNQNYNNDHSDNEGMQSGINQNPANLLNSNITAGNFKQESDTLNSSGDVDKMFAEALGNLSIEERENAFNDLHGIVEDKGYENNPSIIADLLSEMSTELNKIKGGSECEQAEIQNPSYVHNRKFRLMFLRGDFFHPQYAAARMIRFFEMKMILFGPNKLTKDIIYDDLSEDDIESVECGAFQVLPLEDSAGRKVIVGFPDLRKFKDINNFLRAFYYIKMSLLRDESVQKKGVVAILYHVDQAPQDHSIMWHNSRLRSAIPLRFTAGHICYNNAAIKPFITLGMKLCSVMIRPRLRFHYGTHQECQYAMMTFGIPIAAFPMSANGGYSADQFLLWVEFQKTSEEGMKKKRILADSKDEKKDSFGSPLEFSLINTNSAELSKYAQGYSSPTLLSPERDDTEVASSNESRSGTPVPIEPRDADILLGRGVPLQRHPGNITFRKLIAAQAENYEMRNRFEKTLIASDLVASIRERRGRFLKPTSDGGWEELDDATARLKVAYTFRTLRKSKKKAAQNF